MGMSILALYFFAREGAPVTGTIDIWPMACNPTSSMTFFEIIVTCAPGIHECVVTNLDFIISGDRNGGYQNDLPIFNIAYKSSHYAVASLELT